MKIDRFEFIGDKIFVVTPIDIRIELPCTKQEFDRVLELAICFGEGTHGDLVARLGDNELELVCIKEHSLSEYIAIDIHSILRYMSSTF